MDPFGTIWTYLNPFGHIWTHLDIFGPIWTYLDQFGLIQTNMDQFADMEFVKRFTQAIFLKTKFNPKVRESQ